MEKYSGKERIDGGILRNIEQYIGYTFKNKKLLLQVFSLPDNNEGIEGYERMEFFGDAILDFLVKEYLFDQYPQMREGEMTIAYDSVVGNKQFARLIKQLDKNIGLVLPVKRRKDTRWLGDMFEALVAAIYVDSNRSIEAVRDFVGKILFPKIDRHFVEQRRVEPSVALEALLQEKLNRKPEYKYQPTQNPVKVVECKVFVGEVLVGSSSGRNITEAQAEASRDAYLKLTE